jgi:hypothetical protein
VQAARFVAAHRRANGAFGDAERIACIAVRTSPPATELARPGGDRENPRKPSLRAQRAGWDPVLEWSARASRSSLAGKPRLTGPTRSAGGGRRSFDRLDDAR